MALYADRDIATTFEGELQLDKKGDLKIAESPESHISAANFLLRTDNGQYKPNPSVGANLGSLIGEPMTEENLEFAEQLATIAIQDNVLNEEDMELTMLPLDQHDAVCVLEAVGTYMVSGEFVTIEPQVFTYSFPFIEGDPTVQVQ